MKNDNYRNPFTIILFCFLLLFSAAFLTSEERVNLSSLSERSLFRIAENDYNKGQYESALRAFQHAFDKRKGKEHKKYSPLFTDTRMKLADRSAAQGNDALNADLLDDAMRYLQLANSYLTTKDINNSVRTLESSITNRISDLRKLFAEAKAAANEKHYEKALQILNGLLKYESVIDGLKHQIDYVETSYQNELLRLGWDECSKRNWQQATHLFLSVLTRNPYNESAKTGIERINKGVTADQHADTARKWAAETNYRTAVQYIERAIELDQESDEFALTKNQIISEWITSLANVISEHLYNYSNYYSSRDAVISLETLQELNPRHPLVLDSLDNASRVLAANSLEYVDQLSENYKDGARAATTYTLLMNANSRGEKDTVSPQQLMEMAAQFNRKRSSQVVIDISNAASAPQQFENALRARTFTTFGKLELPDLRVRSKTEYESNPQHDPMFWDRRADGKCSVAMLTILIERYFSERKANEVFISSEFVLQMEEQVNPGYIAKRNEIDNKIQEILSGKTKIKKNERALYIQKLEKELELVPRMIVVPIQRNYQYRAIQYTQKTELRIVVNLADLISNSSLARVVIPYESTVHGIEITGVHENDSHGNQNRSLVMMTREEALGQLERQAIEELSNLLPDMIATFTNRFFHEGINQQERLNVDEAVEAFLCHWAFFRGKLPDAASSLIDDAVRLSTGYSLQKNAFDYLRLVNPITTSR